MPLLGEIRIFAGKSAPAGWVLCDGRFLSTDKYQALYSLLGFTYGGNSSQKLFKVPDLRGRAALHMGTGQGLTERKPGDTGGSEGVGLKIAQIPSHSHEPLSASSGPASTDQPDGNALPGESRLYTTRSNAQNLRKSAISSAGMGYAHENRQPYIVVNFIINVKGEYPAHSS